jgi:hypothetical protein
MSGKAFLATNVLALDLNAGQTILGVTVRNPLD